MLSEDGGRPCPLGRILPVATLLDEMDQVLYGLCLRYTLLDALLSLVEVDLPRSCTYIAVVCIGHLSRTIDDTAHDTDLEPLEVCCSCLDLSDGALQVVEGTATARATDELGLTHPQASCLQDTELGLDDLFGGDMRSFEGKPIAPSIEEDAPAVCRSIETEEI